MPAAPLGLLVGLLVQAGPAEVEGRLSKPDPARLEIGVRVELRSGQPSEAPGSNLTDVEVRPGIAFQLPFRLSSLRMSYDPRLFIVAREYPPQEARKTAYLHQGRLILETTPDPRWRLYLESRFAAGDNDFLPLSTVATPSGGTGAPPGQPGTTPTAPTPAPGQSTLPNTRFLPIVDVDASGGLVHSLSPRTQWRLSAGYVYSGGATVAVRTSLPLQKGPRASVGVDWSASRADTLSLALNGSHLRFSNGPQSTLVTFATTWTRAWTRELGTDVMGGVGAIHASAPPGLGFPETNDSIYPVGGLGLRYAVLTRFTSWQNRLTFLAAPAPDRVSGAIDQRLSASVDSAFSPWKPLTLQVLAVGSRSLDTPQRDLRVEVRASFVLGAQLAVSAGGRLAWLEGSNLLGPQGFGWLAFVAIGTVQTRNLFEAP